MYQPEQDKNCGLAALAEILRLRSQITTWRVLVILLVLAVMCLMGLQVYQNQTITAQRALIRLQFGDSGALATCKAALDQRGKK